MPKTNTTKINLALLNTIMTHMLIKAFLCSGLFITLSLSAYANQASTPQKTQLHSQSELSELQSQTEIQKDKEITDSLSTNRHLNADSLEFTQVYQNHCRYLKNLSELEDSLADYQSISQTETQQMLLNEQGRGYRIHGKYGTYLLAIADNINMCAVRAYDIDITTTLAIFRKNNAPQGDSPIRISKIQDSVKQENNKIVTTLAYDWQRNINATYSIEAEEFTDDKTEGKTRLTYRAIMIFNEN